MGDYEETEVGDFGFCFFWAQSQETLRSRGIHPKELFDIVFDFEEYYSELDK